MKLRFFLVLFLPLNWARISAIAHIPVVEALTALSGSAEDIFSHENHYSFVPPTQ